jgi:hypothetical protein
MKLIYPCICAFPGALLGGAVVAETAPSENETQPPPVSIQFFTDDGPGNPLRGLAQSDISILVNQRPPPSVSGAGVKAHGTLNGDGSSTATWVGHRHEQFAAKPSVHAPKGYYAAREC